MDARMNEYMENMKKQFSNGTLGKNLANNQNIFNDMVDDIYNEKYTCECCNKSLLSRNKEKHEVSKGHLKQLSKCS